jgi:hypothetical protein
MNEDGQMEPQGFNGCFFSSFFIGIHTATDVKIHVFIINTYKRLKNQTEQLEFFAQV